MCKSTVVTLIMIVVATEISGGSLLRGSRITLHKTGPATTHFSHPLELCSVLVATLPRSAVLDAHYTIMYYIRNDMCLIMRYMYACLYKYPVRCAHNPPPCQ